MKKKSSYGFFFIAVIFAAYCALIFSACPDDLNRPGESRLTITVSMPSVQDESGSRTLIPQAVFSGYRLSFTGPHEYDDIVLGYDAASVTVEGLLVGQWTIAAIGYVNINGTGQPAAQGSVTVTIVSGTVQNVNIPIRVGQQSGENGSFSYSITYPDERSAGGNISIQSLAGYGNYYRSFSGNSYADTASLSPGFYLVNITLYADYLNVIRSEVLHIYPNLETTGDFSFSDDDFTDVITVSGSVDFKVNGSAPGSINIGVYTMSDSSQVHFGNINVGSNGIWSIMLPAFDNNINLKFNIQAYYNGIDVSRTSDTEVTVKDQSISSVNLGVFDIRVITLSGTVDFKVDGNTPDSINITMYEIPDDNSGSVYLRTISVDSGGTWSVMMVAFESNTNLEFQIGANYNGSSFRRTSDTELTVKDQNISSVNLGTFNVRTVTISGTINVTYNGGPVSSVSISIGGGNHSASLSSPGANASWSVRMEELQTPAQVTLYVSGSQYFNSGNNQFYRSVFSQSVSNSLLNSVSNQDVSGVTINIGNIPNLYSPSGASPLAANTWADVTFNTGDEKKWHSINVSAGVTYNLWWNDANYGSGDKTGYINSVYLWNSSGAPVYLQNNYNAWNNPAVFTAQSSGTVYIEVLQINETNSGTYGIVYSTQTARPGIPGWD